MKKRAILVLVLSLLMSGCSTVMSNQGKQNIVSTKNGSVLFASESTIQSFCEKKTLDSLSMNYDPQAIKTEFNIKNYDNYLYSKNKDNYVTEKNIKKCQYNISYYDYTTDYNQVELGTMDVKKDQIINTKDLKNGNVVKKFIKAKQISANNQLVKYILENDYENLIISDDLNVKEDGKLTLVARPVFRNYHFEDTKKINDYDFSVIAGIKFELK